MPASGPKADIAVLTLLAHTVCMKACLLPVMACALLLAGCNNQQTYASGCGPLPSGWITPRQGRGVLSTLSVISVKGDKAINWNGKSISKTVLKRYLAQTSRLNPIPVTQIKFAPGVDCATVKRLRALMAKNLDCSYGKCAEGGGKWWEVGDVVFPGHSAEPYDPNPSKQ